MDASKIENAESRASTGWSVGLSIAFGVACVFTHITLLMPMCTHEACGDLADATVMTNNALYMYEKLC